MTESVGAKLKSARLQKGLSLEEAHKKTKIHLNILKAIEEDSLVNFSPVYIKGFIKIYCGFLGIDPKDCMPDYKEPKGAISYASDFQEKPAHLFKIPALRFFPLKAIRIKPQVIAGAIVIIIFIIALFNLGRFISLKARRISRRTEAAHSVITPKPQANTAAARSPSPTVKIITLDIHAKDNCLVQVKSDGRVIFQNVLKKGRSESWQAKEKIELSLGNAAAVELEVNGKRISGLGRKGQSLKGILITKEGLSVKR